MNSTVTFARFDAVLDRLGFKKTVVPASHVNYDHPESGAFLLARLHKPGDFVPTYVLFGTRLDLERQGVIDREDFLKMIENVEV